MRAIATDLRAADVCDPAKKIAVPESVVSLQGQHADTHEGMVKVQFELNGQSRTAVVEKRITVRTGPARKSRPVADPDNPLHIAAPMPGSVVTVPVQRGQRVRFSGQHAYRTGGDEDGNAYRG